MQNDFPKYLRNRDFLEKCNAANLQDFAETALQSEFFLDDRYQYVNADGDPDLGFDRVLGCTEESLDAKVLLDPFEEEFHLPAAFVKLRDGQGWKGEVVGEKNESFSGLRIEITDASKRSRIVQGGLGSSELDGLVASQARGLLDWKIGTTAEVQIPLGTDNKESEAEGEAIQATEVDIATVHDIKGTGFWDQLVEDVDIVYFPLCNANKTGDAPSKVQKGMQLDGRLLFSKSCPGKKRKAKVDRRGVQSVGRLLQFHTKGVFGIKLSGDSDQHLSEVGVDPPVAFCVGDSQCIAGNLDTESGMIKFGPHCAKTSFDIPKAFPVGELSECHTLELTEA